MLKHAPRARMLLGTYDMMPPDDARFTSLFPAEESGDCTSGGSKYVGCYSSRKAECHYQVLLTRAEMSLKQLLLVTRSPSCLSIDI